MNTTLNQNRSSNLFIVAGIVITLVVALSAVITSTRATTTMAPNVQQNIIENTKIALAPLSADGFPQYRQSEWHSSAVPVTGISSSEMYHQSERTLVPAQAGLLAYQLSERTLVDTLAEYLASERTMTEAASVNTFAEYFASERTLVDPLAGLATYFDSERTLVPAPFTQFQLSEWFGQ